MTATDMRHLEYLQAVADEDVRTLRRKEATYMGSWKRRGGVGAFMMLARKWDRLEGILTNLASKYDVFVAIELEPSGDDGTSLAEIRDLRQYLALVEAELMARGVVRLAPLVMSETRYSVGEAGSAGTRQNPVTADYRGMDMPSAPEALTPGTPENASAAPWVVPRGSGIGGDLRLAAYVARGQNLFLEPHLTTTEMAVVATCSPRVGALYHQLPGNGYVLNPTRLPVEWRDSWPRLRDELNATEHAAQPAWQRALYGWIEGETKYRIAEEWRAWCGA